MPYVGEEFDDMDFGEERILAFDFAKDLPKGDTIASAIWKCVLVKGIDSDASSHAAAPTIDGTVVKSFISGLKANCTYRLEAWPTTSSGATIDLYSHVRCVLPK